MKACTLCVLFIAVGLMLSACETVAGVGRDIQNAGGAIERSVR
ncbi:MAG: entericidin A/B family lipoprotein [Sphaerospermopsis sp. SIO1G2]|nr:entericidin A/B family lipoprotein [Sphaerospermopsis sp. SIO1G2]